MTEPFTILREFFSTLKDCARYADLLQHRIEAVPDKLDATNIFAAALSDADLSIQAAVELALLSRFPGVPFFGEEHASSRNTKYLAGSYFINESPYLITLDPIDGTRLYLDGKKLYQIVLTVVSREGFEGVLVLYPAYKDYVYAVRGKGAFKGSLDDRDIESAEPWKLQKGASRVYIAGELSNHGDIHSQYREVFTSSEYTKDRDMHYMSSAVRGELSGGIIGYSQVIDGAALSFIAGEMGYLVETFDGKPMPRIEDYPDLILPGLIVGEDKECVDALRRLRSLNL